MSENASFLGIWAATAFAIVVVVAVWAFMPMGPQGCSNACGLGNVVRFTEATKDKPAVCECRGGQ